MSYYENQYFEPNIETFKNEDDGYDNEDNFYYLTENEESKKSNYVDELDNFYQEDNIYQEDNSLEHMNQVPSPLPSNPTLVVKHKKSKKTKKTKKSINWVYTFLAIFIIALIFYYLIDQKIFTLPEFSTSSPSPSASVSVSSSSLGSTFMSLY
jgi:hypothetical protein